jgi:serine/threonine-protein kinase
MTVIYLLTGKQAQQLETDSQTGEIVWRQYASHVSPIIAGVIDRAIAYHPRDRYPTARAMLDTLQSIANPIPATQPLLTQPTLVSAPPPQTVSTKSQSSPQSNSQNNILIGSLIAGGLIGASVIISQMLTKPTQSTADKTVLPSETPSTIASPVIETPIIPTTPSVPTESTPSPTTSIPPIATTTVKNYFWLSQRLVTDADLEGKDGFELDIMRNSIFASHGRRFDTPGLQDYFDKQPWYKPIYPAKSFPAKLLSKLEQHNVDYISKYQDRYDLRNFKK